MKELSIEEKAKRYDEALWKAGELYQPSYSALLEEIFPELKRDEDENIRKELIRAFKSLNTIKVWNGIERTDILAWLEEQGETFTKKDVDDAYLKGISNAKQELEKQCEQKPAENLIETWKDMRLEVYQQASGNRHEPNYSDDTTKMFSLNDIDEIVEKMSEQKSADKVEPKFHEGDIIKPKDGGHEPWQIMQVDIFDKKYRFKDGYVIHFSQEDDYELVEQKPAECNNSALKDKLLELFQRFRWYCKDETPTNGDIIEYVDAHIQELIDTMQKPAWSEEDEKMFEHIIAKATLHFSSINYLDEEEIDFLKSLKDRVQPKQEWGEEDNRMCKAIIDNIQAICEEGYFVGNIDSDELIKWLKSLKERYVWKPSDEQMDALHYVTNFDYGGHKATLVSLYEQLKKLKG